MKKATAAAAIICLFAFLCASHPAAAQEDGLESQSAEALSQPPEDRGAGYLPYNDPSAPDGGGILGAIAIIARTIFSLAFVLGLLYATLWAIKRFTGGAAGPLSAGAASVRVVGRIHLSPKVVVYFLKLADELLVIGTNAGGISLLTTIDDEDAISQIENDLRGAFASVSAPGFSRLFNKSLSKFQNTPEGDDSAVDDQLSALTDQIGRLKGLARRKRHDEE